MNRRDQLFGKRSLVQRRSFTLVELMISISIMGILASATMFALYGVMEDAKEKRTRAVIARINELILDRWDAYQSRPVPVTISATTTPLAAAQLRLYGVRELMRLELPDRKTDVIDSPVTLTQSKVALWSTYRRRAKAMLGATWDTTYSAWTAEQQGAECLYLIVAAMQDGDTNAITYFRESEIGDVDGDGMPEILDGWGNPIRFLRWAPGYLTYSDIQVRDSDIAPDPFDPLKVDPRWTPSDGNATNDPFALYPLIFSAGRDEVFDIVYGNTSTPIQYSNPPSAPSGCPNNLKNDPYLCFSLSTAPMAQMGQQSDDDMDGLNDGDNITNHLTGDNQ